MTFVVFQGTDRSVQQSERPVVIFSDEFGNLAAPKYTKTSVDYKNKAYVAGQGEGDDRVVVIVDLTDGEEARELYVDAKDIQQEEGVTAEEYEALLRQRGLEKLAECPKVEKLRGGRRERRKLRVPEGLGPGGHRDRPVCAAGNYNARASDGGGRGVRARRGHVHTHLRLPLPETLNLGDDTE